MGSSMKPTIFNERVAAALRNWHQTAKKQIKRNKGSITPMSSKPTTPSHHISPVHLLRYYQNDIHSLQDSPRRSNFGWETDSPSPSHPNYGEGSSSSHYLNRGDDSIFHHYSFQQQQIELNNIESDKNVNEPSLSQVASISEHEISVVPKEFSFDRRTIV